MIFESRLFYPYKNFGGLPPQFSTFEESKVVILPVPYEGTVEWNNGTKDGPRTIIDASPNLELYDLELDKEIYRIGICTLPEVEPVMAGPEQMIDRIFEVIKHLSNANKFIVTLGGEHSITLGVVRGLMEKDQSFSVLQLDAHCDLRNEYLGTKYSYASVMRRVMELCPIVQVGIRSLSLEEHNFLKADVSKSIKTIYVQDVSLDRVFWQNLLGSLRQNVYITIDLDVFDPSVIPAVTAPEPGGLTWQQVMGIMKGVAANRNIIGFDIMEFRAFNEVSPYAYMVAKLIYKLIGYTFYGKNKKS